MRRHSFKCRFGRLDKAKVHVLEKDSLQTAIQFVEGKKRFEFGIGDALEQMWNYGIEPSETAFDLLVLAVAVYGADTRINRFSESQDSWSREIDIYLPVKDVPLWEKSRELLSRTLEFLTGDKWRFFFRERPKGFSRITKARTDDEQKEFELEEKPSCVCLFSGGLDSFIGAIDLLENKQAPLLVSHSWVTSVSGHQNQCVAALMKEYGEDRINRLESRAGFPKGAVKGVEGENTERSRSFLFFSLAAFAASGFEKKNVDIFVPENGLISLNVPLDPLRLGSLSTRTTHPYYMRLYNSLLNDLGISAKVFNPYALLTKGEMVAKCGNQTFLGKKAHITMSCASESKSRWLGLAPGHCGFCLPCLIRRASMLKWKKGDKTPYHLNLTARPLNSQKAEGDNVRSFQLAVQKLNGDIRKARVLIHKSGPLGTDSKELESLAKMYLRGMNEVSALLNGVRTSPDAPTPR
ncbi:MAG TPA: Qat anti-phage system QueC-like protein QatC [Verrucomicrobiae bacterium]|nr:Qat anti-phage system QueC-like protein QatC [Verrucomicrobiae bacterium]